MTEPTQKQKALLERLEVTPSTGWVMRTDIFSPPAHDVETLNSLIEIGWVETECGGKVLRLTETGRLALAAR